MKALGDTLGKLSAEVEQRDLGDLETAELVRLLLAVDKRAREEAERLPVFRESGPCVPDLEDTQVDRWTA